MKINSTQLVATASLVTALAIGVLALSTGAEAEQPCRPDVQKLCSGVQPGGGRIVSCLKKHESELSPQCQKMMAQHEQGAAATLPKQ
jgi:hypothetical protein